MLAECFEDFDEFASEVRDANFQMLIQNPKRQSWSLSQISLAGVHVQLGREGSGNITEGWTRSDGYLLFAPLSHAEGHSANGVALDDASIAILGPGRDFCLASRIEHDWCSIFIPTPHLDPFCDSEEAPSKAEKPSCRVTRADRQLADRLRTSVCEIMAAASYPKFESSIAAAVASADLLQLGVTILDVPEPPEHSDGGRPKIPRDEILRRAKALIEEREHAHVSVADLVGATGVSERTLRDAFKESFGVGPKRYLQLRALHQVKRSLDLANPDEASVARVLAQHGEWEFSRFAARYRRLFGELPSETLQRRHA